MHFCQESDAKHFLANLLKISKFCENFSSLLLINQSRIFKCIGITLNTLTKLNSTIQADSRAWSTLRVPFGIDLTLASVCQNRA